MDIEIVNMLEDALDRAKRGEIKAIGIVAATDESNALIGYLDRDVSQALMAGSVRLAHALVVAPEFDETLDAELPARRLS